MSIYQFQRNETEFLKKEAVDYGKTQVQFYHYSNSPSEHGALSK